MKYRNPDDYLTVKRIIDAVVFINIGEAVYTYQFINGVNQLRLHGLFDHIDKNKIVHFCNGDKCLSYEDCYLLNETYID